MRFKDKVIIVTGSGQGIGETYARRLAAEGAAVVVAEINVEKGRAVAAAIVAGGGQARFVAADIGDPASCAALAAETVAAFGGIDGLVNNAAIFAGMRYEPLLTVDLDYYYRFMQINLHGALLMCRAVAPAIIARGGGAIVNQSSTAAYLSGDPGAYYGISKLATNGITAALAAELGPAGVRVNGIAPGPTATEAMAQVDPAIIERIKSGLPLGRLGATDDIADACLFLLSDEARWITGQTLCVDGGMIRRP